jgi:hypothetical protein
MLDGRDAIMQRAAGKEEALVKFGRSHPSILAGLAGAGTSGDCSKSEIQV